MIVAARQRRVLSVAGAAERGCLYCLSRDGSFLTAEHVIPRSLGPATDRYVIPPGVVCDACNHWLGRQVDAPFVDRFDMTFVRGLEGLRGRSGSAPLTIDGRNATARLDVQLDGAKVELYAAVAEETEDGGLDIEIRPTRADPADVVARTMRALWKIALGCIWLARGDEALDPRWDHLRHAILGAPFKGYLLQAPFVAMRTRSINVEISTERANNPMAVTFVMGGVALAVPLEQGVRISPPDVRRMGWDLHTTQSPAPRTVRLRLEPSAT